MSRLLALHPDARVIAGDSRAGRERATRAAMEDGAALIIGGRLPADTEGRRTGEPDLLIAAADGSGYRPADIKHHRCLGQDAGRLARPLLPARPARPGRRRSRSRARPAGAARTSSSSRTTSACSRPPGWPRPGAAAGGIVGVEGVVTWYDLDARCWLTPGSAAARSGARPWRCTTSSSTSASTSSRSPPGTRPIRRFALLVVPVRIGECAECPWWSWCGPQLEAGSGDVSLLPGMGWQAWRIHRDHGVDQPDGAGRARSPHRRRWSRPRSTCGRCWPRSARGPTARRSRPSSATGSAPSWPACARRASARSATRGR